MKNYRFVISKTNQEIFENIHSGKKKIETRAATIRYKDIAVGDTIVFVCNGSSFEQKILRVEHFSSVEDLLKKYKPKDINPKIKTADELRTLYYSFPGYKEKIKKFGLIALTLSKGDT